MFTASNNSHLAQRRTSAIIYIRERMKERINECAHPISTPQSSSPASPASSRRIWRSGCWRRGCTVRGTARRPQTFEVSETSTAGLTRISRSSRPICWTPTSLRRAAAGCRTVVHAAAWTGGAELSDAAGMCVNVEGTANLLRAADREAGVERFVYLSSVAVYGVNRAPLVDEAMPTPLVGQAYPDSKIAAEAARARPQTCRGSSSGRPPPMARAGRVDGRADRADQGGPAGAVGRRSRAGDDRLHRERGGWPVVGVGASCGHRRDVQPV